MVNRYAIHEMVSTYLYFSKELFQRDQLYRHSISQEIMRTARRQTAYNTSVNAPLSSRIFAQFKKKRQIDLEYCDLVCQDRMTGKTRRFLYDSAMTHSFISVEKECVSLTAIAAAATAAAAAAAAAAALVFGCALCAVRARV